MTTRVADPQIAEMSGQAGLPRKSGELVFHNPWERRAFALAVALCQRGVYPWNDFRDHLIAEIAASERAEKTGGSGSPPRSYYENWLAALEKLLIKKGICAPEQMAAGTDPSIPIPQK
jgi:nitrile hydratase accessory protein